MSHAATGIDLEQVRSVKAWLDEDGDGHAYDGDQLAGSAPVDADSRCVLVYEYRGVRNIDYSSDALKPIVTHQPSAMGEGRNRRMLKLGNLRDLTGAGMHCGHAAREGEIRRDADRRSRTGQTGRSASAVAVQTRTRGGHAGVVGCPQTHR